MFGICQTSQETGFTQTVNLQQLCFRQSSAHFPYERGSDWRDTVAKHIQRIQFECCTALELTESVDHRRDEHRVGYPECLNTGAERHCIKALHCHLCCAEDRGREHRGKIGYM